MSYSCKCCNESCGCKDWECGCSGYIPLVARVFLALLFLVFGFEQTTNFAGTVAVVASVVGAPFAPAITVLAIILEFGGALLLTLGYRARTAAWGLILFTAVATLMYHRDMSQPLQMMLALKNLSIIGGLLMVAAYGPGKLSLKCRCGDADCSDCGIKCECGKNNVTASKI